MEINTIVVGDCIDVMGGMPDGCVQCVVTSPPYWGLRDYGNPPRVWGGEAGCEHEWSEYNLKARHGDDGVAGSTLEGGKTTQAISQRQPISGALCQHCGAWRGCLGLEPTPELYVAHLVEIFREIRRILRPDGTVWLNMGDSYAGSWGNAGHRTQLDGTPSHQRDRTSEYLHRKGWDDHRDRPPASYKHPVLKPKDLCGIPWRVAFALQADGWWLRSDIIWHKANAMPESVRDRPTTSHEYLFLLSKSKRYFYDQDAIREPTSPHSDFGRGGQWREQQERATPHGEASGRARGLGRGSRGDPAGRNRRTVWTIPTQPYSGAHFAVFPEKLIEPCIKAGTSRRGACPECGAGWARVVEKSTRFEGGSGAAGRTAEEVNASGKWAGKQYRTNLKLGPVVSVDTIGWRPTCTCGLPDGFKPDDFELILTPTGERVGNDPSLVTGRAGYNRPRGPNEGARPITRYEQRQYAKQLKDSPQREQMEEEAGPAFAHYISAKSGARPIPHELLAAWLGCGWLEQVHVPEWSPPEPIPSLVFDPFMGAGTTALVAVKLGRHYCGAEINAEYVKLAEERLAEVQLRLL